MIKAFRIGDTIQRKSDGELCEITGFIKGWPFGYFALRYRTGFNGKVSVGNANRRFRFVARPVDENQLEGVIGHGKVWDRNKVSSRVVQDRQACAS